MNDTKYKKYFQELKKDGELSRFGKPFKTEEHFYFFDTGTGKVLECNEQEYAVFQQLFTDNKLDLGSLNMTEEEALTAVSGVMEAIETENIFKATPLEHFDGAQMQDIKLAVPQNIQQIILEVTEDCNLRCDYCIYSDGNKAFRNFGSKEMSWETAKKAIDFALRTSKREELYIGFYGGEPLLKFNLIKRCVEYVLENKDEKEVVFSMTTNGVLMTPERAQYFASIPKFSIMFSLDGDKETHDEHRKLKNGQGSFELSFQGYKNALKAYEEKNHHTISISTVVCPPYTKEKFDRMQAFFETSAHNMQMNCTYVERPEKDENKPEWPENASVENRMPMLAWEKKSAERQKERLFTRAQQNGPLLRIHKRPIVNTPIPWHKFNGCCLPGTRRLYVTTEGEFLACERIGESPSIGNVEQGFDLDAIQKYYIDEYVEKSVSDCKNCWASLLCGICYANCYNKSGLNIQKKRRLCRDEKYTLEQHLIYYHEILESDPESLDIFNSMGIY